jgi:hypothetical protein
MSTFLGFLAVAAPELLQDPRLDAAAIGSTLLDHVGPRWFDVSVDDVRGGRWSLAGHAGRRGLLVR